MRETQEVIDRLWNDATKTANRLEWCPTGDGLAPTDPVSVDCAGSEPGYDHPCYNKPAWVLEDFHGYYPTCNVHLGKVSFALTRAYEDDDTNFAVYFHRYKGV